MPKLIDLLRDAAPALGAAMTTFGGIPGAAAAAVLTGVLGLPKDSDEQTMVKALQAATPEQLLALKQADLNFKLQMRLADSEDFKTEVADRGSARQAFAGNDKVFYLALGIYCIFGVCCILQLLGCYWLITGEMSKLDASLMAVVANVVGNISGYLASEAKQVSSYFFGSSAGSSAKDAQISKMWDTTP